MAAATASSGARAVALRGCGICSSSSRRTEAAAILGKIDRLRIGADDFRAVALEFEREIQRSLPAELHDHALRLFAVEDGENIFERERLEIEPVGGVVIGRDRFGIAIHHHGFEAVFLEREGGVAAAIIEFNSLPDAVGTAAENHDFGAIDGARFVLFLVGGIQVRREGFEFGGAGVDALENRSDAEFVAARAHRGRLHVPELGDFFVARAGALGFEHHFARALAQRGAGHALVHREHFLQMGDEPGIDFGEVADFPRLMPRSSASKSQCKRSGPGHVQLFAQQRGSNFRGRAPGGAGLERANALAQRFLKGAADGHHFADRFHLRGERGVAAGKFFELPLGNFRDDVIDARLEGARRLSR